MQISNETDDRITIEPGESIPVVARIIRGSYGGGVKEVSIEESYAERPPREPIRQWVEDNKHRFVVPDGMDAEDVVDEIVAAIERAGSQ